MTTAEEMPVNETVAMYRRSCASDLHMPTGVLFVNRVHDGGSVARRRAQRRRRGAAAARPSDALLAGALAARARRKSAGRRSTQRYRARLRRRGRLPMVELPFLFARGVRLRRVCALSAERLTAPLAARRAPPDGAPVKDARRAWSRATSVIVCAGSGGVGKTTTAAALAPGARGRAGARSVLTIDPARRLADSLGLAALGNERARRARRMLRAHGSSRARSTAMMLDQKGAWDALVERHAPSDEVRERILANRFYQHLSQSFAGSQEYMAVEQLVASCTPAGATT